jgi:putative addiction module component (TIGR02574 family)
MKTNMRKEILALPIKDRIRLVQDVLESIAVDQESADDLSDDQKAELLRRMKDHRKHPERAIPWETVKDRLDRKFK